MVLNEQKSRAKLKPMAMVTVVDSRRFLKSKSSYNFSDCPFIPYSVLEAHEAFKDIDIEVIKDLYVQAGKNKQTLFEILINMGDPEAA